MKLQEIIGFDPVFTARSPASYIDKVKKSVNVDAEGTGAYSEVFSTKSPKRLNQVTKIGRPKDNKRIISDIDDDGYIAYLKAVQAAPSNPYFPIIHDLRIMKTPTGEYYARTNIEKLVKFMSPMLADTSLLLSIYNRMFDVHSYPAIELGENVHSQAVIFQMISIIENVIDYTYDDSYIRDPNLLSAIYLIRNVKDSNPKYLLDLHDDNFMWRVTGTIPQLVIIDPLSTDSAHV